MIRERISGNPAYARFPTNPPAELPTGPQVIQPGQQETTFRGYQPANRSIVYDRHAILNRGTEKSGRESGLSDPMKDGPARPSLRAINRTLSYQMGTDATRNQDDLSRPYTKDSQGQEIGSQDGSWQPVYGGSPGLYQPYGSYAGYTTGPVKGIQGPSIGEPGDGPQKIFGGPPHGLHTATFPDYSQTLGRYMAVPQQVAARVDRPANSPIAGQSYSQTVQPQGQTGTVGQIVHGGHPRNVPFLPGGNWRGA